MLSSSILCARFLRAQARCQNAADVVAARNCRIWTRRNATAVKVDKKVIEKSPLAGIRVLDMTRVLAGVSAF
jgi:succinate--hydroxymethylglutarate CoA-transferase